MTTEPTPSLPRRVAAEFLGTALLLVAVVGSGIMGERLAGGNVAVALLANSIATGVGLVAIILALGAVSCAHLNPVVTLVDALERRLPWHDVPGYVTAQLAGALVGVALAHVMLELPVFSVSTHVRSGWHQWVSEVVATCGLVLVIAGCRRARPAAVPFAVGAYIAGAYWFTASTSFANPAVTLARSLTDTFAGIRPGDVPGFVAAQLIGGACALVLGRWLFGTTEPST